MARIHADGESSQFFLSAFICVHPRFNGSTSKSFRMDRDRGENRGWHGFTRMGKVHSFSYPRSSVFIRGSMVQLLNCFGWTATGGRTADEHEFTRMGKVHSFSYPRSSAFICGSIVPLLNRFGWSGNSQLAYPLFAL